mmetsp:Transcript_6219/g.11295  ORF Transcript_6219/g.11295 Transcript_6219/m.11295 type:complete len:249 (-) Transcript_6219:2669-3415(-)
MATWRLLKVKLRAATAELVNTPPQLPTPASCASPRSTPLEASLRALCAHQTPTPVQVAPRSANTATPAKFQAPTSNHVSTATLGITPASATRPARSAWPAYILRLGPEYAPTAIQGRMLRLHLPHVPFVQEEKSRATVLHPARIVLLASTTRVTTSASPVLPVPFLRQDQQAVTQTVLRVRLEKLARRPAPTVKVESLRLSEPTLASCAKQEHFQELALENVLTVPLALSVVWAPVSVHPAMPASMRL